MVGNIDPSCTCSVNLRRSSTVFRPARIASANRGRIEMRTSRLLMSDRFMFLDDYRINPTTVNQSKSQAASRKSRRILQGQETPSKSRLNEACGMTLGLSHRRIEQSLYKSSGSRPTRDEG